MPLPATYLPGTWPEGRRKRGSHIEGAERVAPGEIDASVSRVDWTDFIERIGELPPDMRLELLSHLAEGVRLAEHAIMLLAQRMDAVGLKSGASSVRVLGINMLRGVAAQTSEASNGRYDSELTRVLDVVNSSPTK
ncbi:hypothetical protein KC930_00745 [Candidatus Saccharibacteria bacterium]|nr:hypothetical protein [Candidatus Saccharibacteria bacterium]